MTNHSLFFALFTLMNILYYIRYNKIAQQKSICMFFHLYFCFMSSFIYLDRDLIECSAIYFIADSFINIYYNVFKTFNKYHHIFALTLIYFNEYLDKKLINLTRMHEISTIFLCLFDMNLISKETFDILFPLNFVFCRLIFYNVNVIIYVSENYENIGSINYFVILLLNIMNLGITIKMRLLHKIYSVLKI